MMPPSLVRCRRSDEARSGLLKRTQHFLAPTLPGSAHSHHRAAWYALRIAEIGNAAVASLSGGEAMKRSAPAYLAGYEPNQPGSSIHPRSNRARGRHSQNKRAKRALLLARIWRQRATERHFQRGTPKTGEAFHNGRPLMPYVRQPGNHHARRYKDAHFVDGLLFAHLEWKRTPRYFIEVLQRHTPSPAFFAGAMVAKTCMWHLRISKLIPEDVSFQYSSRAHAQRTRGFNPCPSYLRCASA